MNKLTTNTISKSFIYKVLISLGVCIVVVSICYLWIDKPLAIWINAQEFEQYKFLKWMTYPPKLLYFFSIPMLIIFPIMLAWKQPRTIETNLFLVAICIMTTAYLKNFFKWVFGRYWIKTWIDNNPSLISDHVYGFNFFHKGSAYESFPSGHTAVIFTAMVFLAICYPRYKSLLYLFCTIVIIGLIGMDYHFLSDVIAGAFLGTIIAICCHKLTIKTP